MPDFLASLASGSNTTDCRLLVVAAHPDDETIDLGIQLRRLPLAQVLQVTEGMAHADFLRGRETYKYFWGPEDCPTFRWRLAIRGSD